MHCAGYRELCTSHTRKLFMVEIIPIDFEAKLLITFLNLISGFLMGLGIFSLRPLETWSHKCAKQEGEQEGKTRRGMERTEKEPTHFLGPRSVFKQTNTLFTGNRVCRFSQACSTRLNIWCSCSFGRYLHLFSFLMTGNFNWLITRTVSDSTEQHRPCIYAQHPVLHLIELSPQQVMLAV